MPTATNAARATFKLETTVKIDISSINEEFGLPPTYEDGSLGTAFVIDETSENSILATAGHMCESDKAMHTALFGDLPVVSVTYVVTSIDGEEHDAHVILDDDKTDICIMTVDGKVARPLRLASRDPSYGETAYYVGAPGGWWPEGGIAPVFMGLYSGHTKNKAGIDKIVFTDWAEGGASGSGVFIPNIGMIGILTQNTHAHDGGGSVSVGSSWREIRKDLTAAKKLLKK